MKRALIDITAQTISRYSDRYAKLGYNVKALGWGSVDQQLYRFAQTLAFPDLFADRSVVDIGCGFGDYLSFLEGKSVPITGYVGMDINPDLIGEAKKRHAKKSLVDFSVGNILSGNGATEPIADVGVMLGVLNFKLAGEVANLEYTELMLSRAFALVRDVLVVDFLSTRLTLNYPKEDFVFYHEPIEALAMALELTDSVILKHDYAPIPQREFMLFLKKPQ